MDASTNNMLHSEEQLRNTLHFEDKEKLRRKLAQLQKEYVKTAQRLKRAEHLDAVRKQVKSKNFLQKHQDQRHSEITSNSSFIFNTNDVSKGSSQCQDAVDCDTSRRSQVILFSPPGDPASPQDPDASSDIAESRRSTSLRLRSRRSRLRWQKNVSALNRSDNGQQQQTQNSSTADQQVTMKEKGVNNETKELFPVPQSESPSLLLTHFCTDKLTKTGHKTVEENQRSKEEREKTTDLNVEGKCGRSALITMREKLSVKENKLISNNIGEDSVRQIKEAKVVACAEGIHENTKQGIPQSTGNEKCVETKEEKNLITADEKAVRLLDSCTLVEGLPFPVEYYIRTTRRMTLSQSQPDMQAVILSQLSTGQHRRRRGRSRGTNEDRQQSNRHTGTNSSTSTTPSTSLNPSNVDTSKNGFQRSCDISGCVLSEAPFSPPVPNLRLPRGRKKGKGWYRPQPLKQGCDQTTGDIRPPNNSLSSRHCICQVSSEKNSLLDLSQQSPTCSCPDQPLGSGAPASLTAEHQEEVFPIFLKNSTCRPQQMTAGTSNWQSLLLPSLPSSSSSQTSPLSLPSLISRLKCLDIQQDFHLPDEQFASLKLHKLRQVAMESGLEHFSTPSHNTRRRSNCLYSSMDPLNPCFLPLGFTPTITDSPSPNQNEQTSAQQTEQVTRDNLNSKWVNEELCNPNISETNVALNAKTPTPVKCTDSQNEVFNKNGKKLFLKSPLDSVESSFSAPNLPSSTTALSPVLPSLGVTPLATNLTFSPSTVSICLPPTENTSTQDPPPPDLLPGSPNTSHPPSLPPSSLCGRIQDLSELLATADQGDEDKPADYPGPSRIQLYRSAEKEEITEKRLPRCTHTLEAPAGGTLVDACCVSGPSGGLCVAAAGKWAVCLWSQTSEFDWSFKHTWTFSEPVINVVSVPGSAGLMIVSLGQLEIRQLSVLSSCSLRQTLMCEGIIQAVASLFNSKVVVALDSATGSDLQVFTLSDSSSVLSSQPLVSPGVCVSTLAPVEELSDAIIGTDDEGHIFIWNVKTGHLLSRVQLEQSLTNTACLRGYSYCGVLLVLLQHEYISSLDQEEDKARETNRMLSENLFSLVSINPLSGKSLLATHLFPPKGWTSRLWEVDVNRSSIMGLGQRCVCVWELRQGGTSQIIEAPEDEDWQLARWGEGETLLIGHQNGNISLYFYSLRPTQKYAKSNTKTPLL